MNLTWFLFYLNYTLSFIYYTLRNIDIIQDLKVAQTAETDDEAIDAEQDEIDLETPITDEPKKE